MTIRNDPPWESFPPETLHALFEAVEIDDVVDPEVSLPDPIDPYCSREDMRRCFALCLAFWSEGVRRADLVRLVGTLLREGDLSPAERLQYKHIRAKYGSVANMGHGRAASPSWGIRQHWRNAY